MKDVIKYTIKFYKEAIRYCLTFMALIIRHNYFFTEVSQFCTGDSTNVLTASEFSSGYNYIEGTLNTQN